jgi:hypothetical protein
MYAMLCYAMLEWYWLTRALELNIIVGAEPVMARKGGLRNGSTRFWHGFGGDLSLSAGAMPLLMESCSSSWAPLRIHTIDTHS